MVRPTKAHTNAVQTNSRVVGLNSAGFAVVLDSRDGDVLLHGLGHFSIAAAAGYYFCLAMIIPEILLYVAAGMIFFVFSSVLFLYGRPSMIFLE